MTCVDNSLSNNLPLRITSAARLYCTQAYTLDDICSIKDLSKDHASQVSQGEIIHTRTSQLKGLLSR